LYYTKRSADAQKKQIKNATATAQKNYELEREKTQLTLAEEQRKNRNLLAQQQSSFKAKLGAGGLSKSGSGQAVLDNMQHEYDMDDKYLTNQANISLEALLNGIDETKTRNLLSMKNNSYNTRSNMINTTSNSATSFARALIK
ncbi:MAG: hypothetical protein ACI4QM_04765, partial [Alphaproteobacteria bacterium]